MAALVGDYDRLGAVGFWWIFIQKAATRDGLLGRFGSTRHLL